ncbi:hypothetical protein HYS49_01585 [Candidatus Woesearchaeota archaeon]|nr:hypothetical protein [Candidatus Woesearchaeota archaeon]
MDKKAFLPSGILIKIFGAVIGSIGFFFTAFGRSVVGAALIGLGAVLLAVGEKTG